jgi:hypothetical protein
LSCFSQQLDRAAAPDDVVEELHGVNHLLVDLDAHPVRHPVQVVRVEPGDHRQVDVGGLQLVLDLLVHLVAHPLRYHLAPPPLRSIPGLFFHQSSTRGVSLSRTRRALTSPLSALTIVA